VESNENFGERPCIVVVNAEEQYSIWPANRLIPQGWRSVGIEGTRDRCLSYVKEVWTDMRPLSVRSSCRVK
jgi:MbtH protein